MFNTNDWYVFDGGTIPPKTCDYIKNWAEDKWEPATADIKDETTDEERQIGRLPDYQLNPKARISDVAWCNEQWLYDTIFPYMNTANEQAGWKYDIRGAESAQITRYQPGGFYSFHQDGPGDHLSAYNYPDNKFLHGHVRKLSMSVILNGNYQGGVFEFASYNREKCFITPVESSAGTVIVFPSSMEHRVTPVTKGIRYSLVCWFLGPPFV